MTEDDTMQSAQDTNKLKVYTHQRPKICSNFGLKHKFKSCPAYLDTCHACGANGHWSNMCRKTKNIQKPVQKSNVRRGRSKSRQLHHRSNNHREFGELKAEEQSDSE